MKKLKKEEEIKQQKYIKEKEELEKKINALIQYLKQKKIRKK